MTGSLHRPWAWGVAVVAAAAATPAMAYVGPGAGLTLIGSLVAVLVAALLAIAGLVIFPVRMALKRMRAAKEAQPQAVAVTESDPG